MRVPAAPPAGMSVRGAGIDCLSHHGRVGRVIWINGCFSVGKTSVAEHLAGRLSNAFVLDPEVIGAALRDGLVPPALYPGDFQDLKLWRSFTRDAVIDAARLDGFVIVPMTIAHPDYFEEVIGGVRRAAELTHFTLMASRATILDREARRPDETGGWAVQMVDRVLLALDDARFARHVDTEAREPEEVSDEILRHMTDAREVPGQ